MDVHLPQNPNSNRERDRNIKHLDFGCFFLSRCKREQKVSKENGVEKGREVVSASNYSPESLDRLMQLSSSVKTSS